MQPSLATEDSLGHQPSEPIQAHIPKRTPQRGLTQAYEVRDIAANHALELKDEPADDLESKALRARALKDNVLVWEIACNRIRVFKGQPNPGSLRPIAKPKKLKSANLPPPTEVRGQQSVDQKESLTRGETVPTPPTPNSPT